ncbi:hypothetical protein Taro_053524, partial [Colocasia esculenta]|nr:hypothetical protein [Colocasia esculenta]
VRRSKQREALAPWLAEEQEDKEPKSPSIEEEGDIEAVAIKKAPGPTVATELPVTTVIQVATTSAPDGHVLAAVWAVIALWLVTRRPAPSRSEGRRLKALVVSPFPFFGLSPFPPLRGGEGFLLSPPVAWSSVVPAVARGRAGAAARSEEEAVVHREGPFGVSVVVATPGCSILAVYLPADVATAERVATSEKASPRLDGLVMVALTVAMVSRQLRRAQQDLVCLGCFLWPWLACRRVPQGRALEGLSVRWVVTVTWDPQPRASVSEGVASCGGRAQVTDLEQKGKMVGAGAPSHCLALRWFRSHVGRSGVGPQLGRAAVVCGCVLGCDSLASLYRGVVSALRVLSGCLVRTPDYYFCNPFLGAVGGGTGRCSSLTSWSVRVAGWFCLWALDLVKVFRVMFGLTRFLLLWLVRDWRVFAAAAGCACCESGCCFACVAVGFDLGLHVIGIFARAKQMLMCRIAPLVEHCDTCLWLLPALCWLVANSGEVLSEFFSLGSGGGLRYAAVVLAVAFWWVFPEQCLGGSGGERLLALWVEILPKLPCVVPLTVCLAVVLARLSLCSFVHSRSCWRDFVCPQGQKVGFISRALWWLCQMVVWSLPLCCLEVELVASLMRVVSLWCDRSLVERVLPISHAVLASALVHCVVPWVAPGADVITMCVPCALIVALLVVRQALVVACVQTSSLVLPLRVCLWSVWFSFLWLHSRCVSLSDHEDDLGEI